MQQLDIFGTPVPVEQPKPKKAKVVPPVAEKAPAKKETQVMTDPLGNEMVVNDQIKVKVKQIKSSTPSTKHESKDNGDLIERIKAKLRKEFDLTTPVERNDEDQSKTPRSKTNASEASFSAPPSIPPDEELNKKMYYSMSEVSEMFHVHPSMLRLWENEFDIVNPKRNKKGDRHFRPVDIRNLELIYHLIRNRKFTIQGAKTFIKQHKKRAADTFAAVQQLQQLRSFLLELKKEI